MRGFTRMTRSMSYILTVDGVDRHHFIAKISADGRLDLQSVGGERLQHALGIAVGREEDQRPAVLREGFGQARGEALQHVRAPPGEVEETLGLSPEERRIEKDEIEA